MNQPVPYIHHSDYQMVYNLDLLQKYLPLIELKKSGANILDIGCGPGNSTVEALLPLMPSNFKALIGCDVCEEMIGYAKRRYGSDRIDFVVVDVEGAEIPPELENRFDHVFSFWCLHWVVNQRLSFSNINRLMKQNGTVLLSYVSSHPYFDTVKYLASTEKWGKHMGTFNKYYSPFFDDANRGSYFREILSEAGFDVRIFKDAAQSYTFRNLEEFDMTFRVADPFLVHMDRRLHDDYMEDLVEGILRRSGYKDDREKFVLTYSMFIIVANKK